MRLFYVLNLSVAMDSDFCFSSVGWMPEPFNGRRTSFLCQPFIENGFEVTNIRYPSGSQHAAEVLRGRNILQRRYSIC
jgi:hypothetical protein